MIVLDLWWLGVRCLVVLVAVALRRVLLGTRNIRNVVDRVLAKDPTFDYHLIEVMVIFA
jgi:hypothetical protein